MTVLFISDLHLDESRPHITEIFINFLKNQAYRAQALYILGDLFEVWVGDDNKTALNETIIQALKTLTTKGVPVYLMHGNRDVFIGKRFAKASGCQIIKDPTVISLYGSPTLLMHGDSLCIDDIEYQKFRAKVRNIFVRFYFLLKPLKKRKAIAQHLRESSKKRNQTIQHYLMDVNAEEVKRIMQKYKVKKLIHGHTHQPSIEHFQLQKELVSRIVLSDWESRGNALVCTQDEERLIYFD